MPRARNGRVLFYEIEALEADGDHVYPERGIFRFRRTRLAAR